MTFERISRLAIDALEHRRKVYAPEANMHRLGGIDTPATQRARKAYDELTEAIAELRDLAKAGRT